MQNQTDKLLVRTPSVFEGESVLGYLLRLSNNNGMMGVSAILRKSQYKKLLSEGFLLKWLSGKVDLGFISELTGDMQNERELKHENQPKFVHRSTYSVYRPKLCPVCIAQYGHIPLHNEYVQQLICPTHQVVLIDKCHKCHLRIGWQRKFLEKCNCGEPFINQPLLLANKEIFSLFIEFGLVSDENGIFDEGTIRKSGPVWQNARYLLRTLDAIANDVDFEFVSNEQLYNAVLNSLLLNCNKDLADSYIERLRQYKEKEYSSLLVTCFPAEALDKKYVSKTSIKNTVQQPSFYTPLPAHGQGSGIVRDVEQDLHIVSNLRMLSANSKSIIQCTDRSLDDRLSAQADLSTTADALNICHDQLEDLVDDEWFEGLMHKRPALNGWVFDLFLINIKLAAIRNTSRVIKLSEQQYHVAITDQKSLSNFGVRLSKLLKSKYMCSYERSTNAGFSCLCVSIDVLENALMHDILQDRLMTIDDAATSLSTEPVIVYLLNKNELFRNGREIYVPNNKNLSMLAFEEFKKTFTLLNSVAASNHFCVDELSDQLINRGVMACKRIHMKNGSIFVYENTPDVWRQINDIIQNKRAIDPPSDV